jgi:hypothetical protein
VKGSQDTFLPLQEVQCINDGCSPKDTNGLSVRNSELRPHQVTGFVFVFLNLFFLLENSVRERVTRKGKEEIGAGNGRNRGRWSISGWGECVRG